MVGRVAIVSRSPNQLDLFAVGADGAIYTKAHDGTSWWPGDTTWSSLGGNAFLDLDVSSPSPSRLEVVARGRDKRIWKRSWSAGFWL